jgi:hypothetical protein
MIVNLHFPLIRTTNKLSESKLIEILNDENFYIIKLNGQRIYNEVTFFKEIVNQSLPLDPPLSGNVHYDAFNDSLWGGLSELPSEKVALIWTGFNKMLDKGFNDFLQISQCIYKIAEDLTHIEYGIDHKVDLKVFLIGEGTNFPVI